jgi:hypothetical protein
MALNIRVPVMSAKASPPQIEPKRAKTSGAIPVRKINKTAHNDPKVDPKAWRSDLP